MMAQSIIRGRILSFAICLLAATAIAILISAGTTVQKYVRQNERYNRIVLVRELVQEHHLAHPKRHLPDPESGNSWRWDLLQDLLLSNPSLFQRYSSLAAINLPLDRSSPRPTCFGSGHLSVFRVLPNPSEMEGNPKEFNESQSDHIDSAILIEADFGTFDWTSPIDLHYSGDQVWLGDDANIRRDIEVLHEFYLLRGSGEILWIRGPVSASQFVAIVRGEKNMEGLYR